LISTDLKAKDWDLIGFGSFMIGIRISRSVLQWHDLHIVFDSPVAKYVHYYYSRFIALWILARTTRMNQYQEGKTNLELLEQEIMSSNGISWAICKSASRPRHNNHASIPLLSFFTGRMRDALPAAQPTVSKH